MGSSGKPDTGYRLADHIAFVDAFVEVLGLADPVLVGHDWGGPRAVPPPGVLVTSATIASCREHVPRLTLADVGGPAGNVLPGDRPPEVAAALLTWLRSPP